MSLFRSRTQPCETACPISHGVFVPWTPTTPPPGQSESFEYPLVSNANAPRIGYLRGDEARLDEEEPDRRLHPSRADCDGAGSPEPAVDVELELPGAAVDDEPAVDRRHVGRRGRDPARPAVGASRDRDAVPRRLAGAPDPRVEGEHGARVEVGPELRRASRRPARRGSARCERRPSPTRAARTRPRSRARAATAAPCLRRPPPPRAAP